MSRTKEEDLCLYVCKHFLKGFFFLQYHDFLLVLLLLVGGGCGGSPSPAGCNVFSRVGIHYQEQKHAGCIDAFFLSASELEYVVRHITPKGKGAASVTMRNAVCTVSKTPTHSWEKRGKKIENSSYLIRYKAATHSNNYICVLWYRPWSP